MDATYFTSVLHKLWIVWLLYLCLKKNGVPLLPSSSPLIIWFQSVRLKAVIFGAGYTTEHQSFLWIVDTTKENELYHQFHVCRKIRCSVSYFNPRYPTAKPKATNRTSLLVEDISVSGKVLGMDQNWLIDKISYLFIYTCCHSFQVAWNSFRMQPFFVFHVHALWLNSIFQINFTWPEIGGDKCKQTDGWFYLLVYLLWIVSKVKDQDSWNKTCPTKLAQSWQCVPK